MYCNVAGILTCANPQRKKMQKIKKYSPGSLLVGNLRDFSAIFKAILSGVPTAIGSLFHYGRSGFALPSVYQFRYSLDPLNNVFPDTVFTWTRSEIISRHVKSSPWIHRYTTGWCTVWETFSVRWVTELRFTRLHRLRVRNGTT